MGGQKFESCLPNLSYYYSHERPVKKILFDPHMMGVLNVNPSLWTSSFRLCTQEE